jgi:hypothetical protein
MGLRRTVSAPRLKRFDELVLVKEIDKAVSIEVGGWVGVPGLESDRE